MGHVGRAVFPLERASSWISLMSSIAFSTVSAIILDFIENGGITGPPKYKKIFRYRFLPFFIFGALPIFYSLYLTR